MRKVFNWTISKKHSFSLNVGLADIWFPVCSNSKYAESLPTYYNNTSLQRNDKESQNFPIPFKTNSLITFEKTQTTEQQIAYTCILRTNIYAHMYRKNSCDLCWPTLRHYLNATHYHLSTFFPSYLSFLICFYYNAQVLWIVGINSLSYKFQDELLKTEVYEQE